MNPEEYRLPRHVGIIPDANRRGAILDFISSMDVPPEKIKSILKDPKPFLASLPRDELDNLLMEAYMKGAENVRDNILYLLERGVDHVTFYAFSSKNFERTPEEKEAFFTVFSQYIPIVRDLAHDKKMKVNFAGNLGRFLEEEGEHLSGLGEHLYRSMLEVEDETEHYTGGQLNILSAYYLDDEIEHYRETGEWWLPRDPPIDLAIRTILHPGDKKLSGFPATDAVLYFPEVSWGRFSTGHIDKALDVYADSRQRKGR